MQSKKGIVWIEASFKSLVFEDIYLLEADGFLEE